MHHECEFYVKYIKKAKTLVLFCVSDHDFFQKLTSMDSPLLAFIFAFTLALAIKPSICSPTLLDVSECNPVSSGNLDGKYIN